MLLDDTLTPDELADTVAEQRELAARTSARTPSRSAVHDAYMWHMRNRRAARFKPFGMR